jgi:HK97 gp10 family phage protein
VAAPDVEGFDELFNALEETKINLTQKRKLLAKGLRGAGKIVEDEGRRRISVLTGRARESMSTAVVGQTATGAEAQIGPKMFYPKFPEYGTSHQPGRPWLGPAYDSKVDEAVDKFGEIVGDGIEEAFRG